MEMSFYNNSCNARPAGTDNIEEDRLGYSSVLKSNIMEEIHYKGKWFECPEHGSV